MRYIVEASEGFDGLRLDGRRLPRCQECGQQRLRVRQRCESQRSDRDRTRRGRLLLVVSGLASIRQDGIEDRSDPTAALAGEPSSHRGGIRAHQGQHDVARQDLVHGQGTVQGSKDHGQVVGPLRGAGLPDEVGQQRAAGLRGSEAGVSGQSFEDRTGAAGRGAEDRHPHPGIGPVADRQRGQARSTLADPAAPPARKPTGSGPSGRGRRPSARFASGWARRPGRAARPIASLASGRAGRGRRARPGRHPARSLRDRPVRRARERGRWAASNRRRAAARASTADRSWRW